MPTPIENQVPQSMLEVNIQPRGSVFPSPTDWRDQFLYFLLPDRFSDAEEGTRPTFDRNHSEQHFTPDRAAWQIAGKNYQGGTLKGIQSKLDYIKSLGVTALWIGPIFKQRADLDTYHGYGIQHFLDVEPRFGSRQDLRDLVDAAHERDIYVLLDVIYNHSGNNWFYNQNDQASSTIPYRYQPPQPFHSWRSAGGNSTLNIDNMNDAVWPTDFQNVDWYTRAGQIGRWDPEPWEDPLHPDNEFRRGDFFDLKDLNLQKNEVLNALIKVYQYWIALSDCDGFRIDTVKHVSFEASRNFCGAIHEYCESIGKSNFLLLGEVTGGDSLAKNYLDIFGRNIDAVLDIGTPTTRLSGMVKGSMEALHFFEQFQGHEILGSHRETGRYHVSILDDHDMVGRSKHRFAAHNTIPQHFNQTAHAVGVQLTTLGIPCIYYGTEQAFDGTEDLHDNTVDHAFEDRYIREAMFGAMFGAFKTSGCHFFVPDHPTYLRISAIAKIRNAKDAVGLCLRRGRQYLRETSILGQQFSYPGPGELVAWSRIMVNQEVLIVLNTHGTEARGAEITVDASLHQEGQNLRFLYRGDWSENEILDPPQHVFSQIHFKEGRGRVHLALAPASMAILA